MQNGFIIAIDGPVASGKGTIAKELAKRLNGFYLTTGLFYRAVTLYCLHQHIDVHTKAQVIKALSNIHITVRNNAVILNGIDSSKQIYEKKVDEAVAVIANYPAVRQFAIPQQQAIGNEQIQKGEIIIVEGRDIATKVFPQAPVKIYITADVETRAKRRLLQIQKKDSGISFNQVLAMLKQRDQLDMYGSVGYLVSDPENYDYDIVDSTHLTEVETVEKILDIMNKKGLI